MASKFWSVWLVRHNPFKHNAAILVVKFAIQMRECISATNAIKAFHVLVADVLSAASPIRFHDDGRIPFAIVFVSSALEVPLIKQESVDSEHHCLFLVHDFRF